MVYKCAEMSIQAANSALGVRLRDSFVSKRKGKWSEKSPIFAMPVILLLAHLSSQSILAESEYLNVVPIWAKELHYTVVWSNFFEISDNSFICSDSGRSPINTDPCS